MVLDPSGMHSQQNTHTRHQMPSSRSLKRFYLPICLENCMAHLAIHLMDHSNLDSTGTRIDRNHCLGSDDIGT